MVQRVQTVRREEADEFSALRVREAGANSHMLKVASIIEKAEQEGPDGLPLSTFVPAEASDDTVAFTLMLHLQHRALIGLVDARRLFRHHAIEACPLEAAEPISGRGNVARHRREVERWNRSREQRLKGRSPLLKWHSLQVSIALAQEIEKDHRCWNLFREFLHARLGRVKAQLERLKVEPFGAH